MRDHCRCRYRSPSRRVNLAEEEDGDDGAQGQRNLQARASATSSSDEHSSSDEDETVDMISTRGRKIQQSIILNHQRMNLQFTTIMATMMVCMYYYDSKMHKAGRRKPAEAAFERVEPKLTRLIDQYKAGNAQMQRDKLEEDMKKCQDLVVECGAAEDSVEYFAAGILFKKAENRIIFLDILKPEARLLWLQRWCRVKNLY